MKQESGKVKCPECNTEVIDANFCEHCGAKCKGYNLHIELFNRKGT